MPRKSPVTKSPADAAPELAAGNDLVDLQVELHRLESRADQLVATIDQAPDRIEAAIERYHEAFGRADKPAMQAAQGDIKSINDERDGAAAELAGIAPAVEPLSKRQHAIRLKALDSFSVAQKAAEQARQDVIAKSAALDAVGTLGGQISRLWVTVQRFSPAEEAAAVPESKATPAATTSPPPLCPYCRSARDTKPLGDGRWTCARQHHGKVFFDDAGRVIHSGSHRRSAG